MIPVYSHMMRAVAAKAEPIEHPYKRTLFGREALGVRPHKYGPLVFSELEGRSVVLGVFNGAWTLSEARDHQDAIWHLAYYLGFEDTRPANGSIREIEAEYAYIICNPEGRGED